MKYKFRIILLLAIGLTLFSCDDFGDTNVNPNEPTYVKTETLLTGALRSVSSVIGSDNATNYPQHISDITYTEDSRYQTTQVDFSGWYTGPLANLQHIIDLNTDPATAEQVANESGPNANQIAVAKILQAYFYHFLTDTWGPLPFSNALQGDVGVFTPTYDSQEAIYDGIFQMCKEATSSMVAGSINGDYLFNGDMDAWKRFANTLRFIAALRMADVNESKARTEFLDAMNAGLITDNVMYPYLAESNNENPWFSRYRTREDYGLSTRFVDMLKAQGDPRLFSYADPTKNSQIAGNPEYVGMPYGLAESAYSPATVSFPNSTFVKAQDAPLPIYTMAQVHFSMTEAALRGWINDDPETHYIAGIKASWDQWGVDYDQAEFDAYYNQDGIKWDDNNGMNLMAYQKWVALFIQGYEAWAEVRRLDYPEMIMPEEPLNPSGQYPVRFMYPTTEFGLNEANVEAAVNNYLSGQNSDAVRLWWDVK